MDQGTLRSWRTNCTQAYFLHRKNVRILALLQPKDPQRSFGELEREILYFRSNKRCAVCGAPAAWNEAEIHHVVEHSFGGKTDFDNAVLVYSFCHPKGEAATKDFAGKFFAAKQAAKDTVVQIDEDTVGCLWNTARQGCFCPILVGYECTIRARTIMPGSNRVKLCAAVNQ